MMCLMMDPYEAGCVVHPLAAGSEIPAVTVKTLRGGEVQLRKAVSRQPTVVIFYHGGWCPYCRAWLLQIRGLSSRLYSLRYEIIAISPDRREKIAETDSRYRPGFALLSDSEMRAGTAFGIGFRVNETALAQYLEVGINLEDASGQNHHLLPVPAIFVVGRDCKVRAMHVNPDYSARMDPDMLMDMAAISARRE